MPLVRLGHRAARRLSAGLALALLAAAAAVPVRAAPEAIGTGAASAAADVDARRNREVWERLVAAEELVLALDPVLARLTRSLRNLELPDRDARALLAPSVEVVDIAGGGLAGPRHQIAAAPAVSTRSARIGEPAVVAGEQVKLWAPFLDEVEYVDSGKFGVLAGTFANDERTRFDQDLVFKGHARLRSGADASVKSRVRLSWVRDAGSDAAEPASWRIAGFRTQSFDVMESAAPLFEEVLDRAMPDADSRRAARASEHERLAAKYLADRTHFVPPHPYFTVQAHDRHPSVSVVDIDRDGYDDLYVMPELGRNQLFVNQRDGTFRERAADFGLDISDHCSSAMFADFDNDGDLDVFIGRTLRPSMVLENRGGRFVDRSAEMPKEALPQLVGSLSLVDYDRDGLLDVYVSTYAANAIQRSAYEGKDPAKAPESLLAEFLPAADAKQLGSLVRSGRNEFRDLPGPPNVLLRNRGGGRFEVAPSADALRVFRNTYQSTWADFDGDGDEDVYLANDFAPHDMVRNDGGGKFTDVTDETGTADTGFGMGATWGDYDEDGRQDLYVSNMYSKAGSRITAALPLDPTWAKMARGNTLFRNRGTTFEQVSGQTSDKVEVEIAGWSWGGQFCDFNNDGRLDLFVPNGYYTAPEEHALPVDI